MVLLCAVQREAYEERVGFEKGSPLFIQTNAIGLDAVEHRDIALHGTLRFQKEPEEIQPGKSRFAALKQKMDAAAFLCGCKSLFNQFSCHFMGKQSHIFAGSAVGNIVIKAVPATQIAQAGRWLDEKCIMFHRDSLRDSQFLKQGYRKIRAFASSKTYGTRLARLWKLFLSTLYISSFTFGGGFVIVTFMKKKFVDELHWIDEQEMLDMTALAQSSPGAIAVNAAILVGWQVEGLIGMIVAVLGTIIPPMVILSVISVFYNAFATNRYIALLLKGMQAGVAAVILDVVFDLGGKVLKTRSWVYIALMVAAFVANTVFDVNVVVVILAAAVFGVVLALVQWKKGGAK